MLLDWLEVIWVDFPDAFYARQAWKKMARIWHDPMGEAESPLVQEWTRGKACWKGRAGKKIRIIYEIRDGRPEFIGVGPRDSIYQRLFGRHVSER